MPKGRRAGKSQALSRLYVNSIVADIARIAATKERLSTSLLLDSYLRRRPDYVDLIREAKKLQIPRTPQPDDPQETSQEQADPTPTAPIVPEPSSPVAPKPSSLIAALPEAQNVNVVAVSAEVPLTPAARIFAQVFGAPPAKDAELLDQILQLAGSQKIFLAWVKAFAADGGKTPMEMLRGLHRWTK